MWKNPVVDHEEKTIRYSIERFTSGRWNDTGKKCRR